MLRSPTFFATLDQLSQSRVAWQGGSLKKSNDELFAILSQCVGVYAQVVVSRQLRKNIADGLVARKIPFNENASLATRVVRWVFGDCGKRAYAYANVIEAAAQQNIDPADVANWIHSNGGIESIRRSGKNGKIDSQRKLELRMSAEEYFTACAALFEISDKVPSLAPAIDASHAFTVALVRQSQSGASEIVFGSHNGTLINSLLAEAGKSVDVKQRASKLAAAESNKVNSIASVVAEIVATASEGEIA